MTAIAAPGMLLGFTLLSLTTGASAQVVSPMSLLAERPPAESDAPDEEAAKEARNELTSAVTTARGLGLESVAERLDLAQQCRDKNDSTWTQKWTVSNKLDARCYWGQDEFEFANAIALGGFEDGESATIELLSAFWGPARVSLTGVLADGDEPETVDGEEPQKDGKAVEQFFAGGGPAVFTAAWPVVFYRADEFSASAQLAPRLGFDIPELGGAADDTRVNMDLGAVLQIRVGPTRFGGFLDFRPAYVLGKSGYYQDLGLAESEGFSYGRLTAGLTLVDKFLLSWSTHLFGPDELQSDRIFLTAVPGG